MINNHMIIHWIINNTIIQSQYIKKLIIIQHVFFIYYIHFSWPFTVCSYYIYIYIYIYVCVNRQIFWSLQATVFKCPILPFHSTDMKMCSHTLTVTNILSFNRSQTHTDSRLTRKHPHTQTHSHPLVPFIPSTLPPLHTLALEPIKIHAHLERSSRRAPAQIQRRPASDTHRLGETRHGHIRSMFRRKQAGLHSLKFWCPVWLIPINRHFWMEEDRVLMGHSDISPV